MTTRSAVIALAGPPNAGKSTLVNQAVGAKVSIVTHKVQTTRTRVRGIALLDETQLIFVDTPGIFVSPRRRLERAMVGAAWNAVEDADFVVVLHDARKPAHDEQTALVIEGLKERKTRRVLLAINKIDEVKRERLLALAQELAAAFPFERVFMISALTGDGVDDLLSWLASEAPEAPWLYPEDEISDLPQRLLAAEITREKLFLHLHDELPYALTVETESWETFRDGSVKISQTIYVQRDAHKRMAIGAKGATIRKIRELAQRELEEILETSVHLFLFVKVRERWVDDPERYQTWGLDFSV